MKFSIVIPAHDEECFISRCLDSITRASAAYPSEVETIVVLNRCTDDTEKIARDWGARVIGNEDKNLAKIRNAGAKHATGDILVTIDADSWMSENMLQKIDMTLQTGKYIGGGVSIHLERVSLGIILTGILLKMCLLFTGLSGGLYWCYRRDFEAIGGFNEKLLVAEDLDFAQRLKTYGREHGKRFITLRGAHIMTSCRKFDHFGDWVMLKMLFFHGRELKECFTGQNTDFPNQFFYDFKHKQEKSRLPSEPALKN